jgi:hypothetical protein
VQVAHVLDVVLAAYAKDHGGRYPDGANSTEVFQQLLDQGYISDPKIFYVPMAGKTQAPGDLKKLKPENVCWDVTGGVNASDSDRLPMVFLTGFHVTYSPGGGAVPIIKPWPPYQQIGAGAGLAVAFKDDTAMWVVGEGDESLFHAANYRVPKIVPADFDAHGKTYRQLTPDGVLR